MSNMDEVYDEGQTFQNIEDPDRSLQVRNFLYNLSHV